MLDKIKNGVKDIPISADAFGFAAVMASVAPVPDAIGNLVTSIRYIALSHSVWSVLQPAIPVIILALAAIAFCKNNYKVALAAGIVATIYFLLPASHMSTEPVVIQLCDTICLAGRMATRMGDAYRDPHSMRCLAAPMIRSPRLARWIDFQDQND